MLPQTLLWGPSPIMIHPHAEKKSPPPPLTEKMAPTWREKTAHIEKIPHRGKSLPPTTGNFFIHGPPPPSERLYPPLRAPIMVSTRAGDWVCYPIYFVKPSHWVCLSPCATQISGLRLTMRLPRLSGVGYIEILSAHYGLLFEI